MTIISNTSTNTAVSLDSEFDEPKPTPFRLAPRKRRDHLAVAELLVARSDHIPTTERALIRAVYLHGKPLNEVARLLGEPSRSVTRRIKRIARRLLSPAFVLVVSRRSQWPQVFRAVAEETVLKGRSLRDAAKVSGLSYHVARRHHDAMLSMVQALPPSKQEGR